MDEENKENTVTTMPIKRKKKVSTWKIATVVLVILLAASILTNGFRFGGVTGAAVSDSKAGEGVLIYVNSIPGITATLDTVEEDGNFYIVDLLINDNPVGIYVTKDGKMMFPSEPINLEETPTLTTTTTQETQEIPKTDIPEVELFIMSYCPYGTQAEKAILPVQKLFGDKIDLKIRFVDYAMHDKTEIDENLLQYCIQKEQEDKYWDYLKCFLEAGESESCLDSMGIDKDMLNSCVSATDDEYKITENYNDKSTWQGSQCPDGPYCFPVFDIERDLNEQYGVGGSPTFIINGEEVSPSSRSPDAVKTLICGAFTEIPEECNTELSTSAASAGFGFEEGTDTTATC